MKLLEEMYRHANGCLTVFFFISVYIGTLISESIFNSNVRSAVCLGVNLESRSQFSCLADHTSELTSLRCQTSWFDAVLS